MTLQLAHHGGLGNVAMLALLREDDFRRVPTVEQTDRSIR